MVDTQTSSQSYFSPKDFTISIEFISQTWMTIHEISWEFSNVKIVFHWIFFYFDFSSKTSRLQLSKNKLLWSLQQHQIILTLILSLELHSATPPYRRLILFSRAIHVFLMIWARKLKQIWHRTMTKSNILDSTNCWRVEHRQRINSIWF